MYMARGPISNDRIQLLDNGKVQVKLKTQWSDGTTHLQFTPHELLEKLTALIPPPKSHLTRWSGAFAPASPLRNRIILKPEVKKAFQFSDDPINNRGSASWAKLLERVFKIDVTSCSKCKGKLHPVCAVQDPDQIQRYLKHIGLPHLPPEKPPAKSQSLDYEF